MNDLRTKFLNDVLAILNIVEDGVREILGKEDFKDEDVPTDPYDTILMMIETMYIVQTAKQTTGLKELEKILNDMANELEDSSDKNEIKTGIVRILSNKKEEIN